jgi:HD-GYP domain-containing protein (c-di-GMP phosphodiesterase class II)
LKDQTDHIVFEDIFETVREPVLVLNPDLTVVSANRNFYHTFKITPNKTIGRIIYDLGKQQWNIPGLRILLEEILKKENRFDNYEVEHVFEDIGRKIVLFNARRVNLKGIGSGLILLAMEDITGRKQTEDDIKQNFLQTRKALEATIHAISSLAERRDPYVAGHQHRVADLARAIATEMGLTTDRIEGIGLAAAIHDIGKISIPTDILGRPTKLTGTEFNFVKTHAKSGYDILKDIKFPWPIARMIIEHHERMNGSGYPKGLAKDSTLLESRILAVADVVEAMNSRRPYRPALGIDAALNEITGNKSILYDPEVVEACLRIFKMNNYKFESRY